MGTGAARAALGLRSVAPFKQETLASDKAVERFAISRVRKQGLWHRWPQRSSPFPSLIET